MGSGRRSRLHLPRRLGEGVGIRLCLPSPDSAGPPSRMAPGSTSPTAAPSSMCRCRRTPHRGRGRPGGDTGRVEAAAGSSVLVHLRLRRRPPVLRGRPRHAHGGPDSGCRAAHPGDPRRATGPVFRRSGVTPPGPRRALRHGRRRPPVWRAGRLANCLECRQDGRSGGGQGVPVRGRPPGYSPTLP